MPSRLFLDIVDPWINWSWLSTHVPTVLAAVQQHVILTVIALVGGFAIALPLGIAAHRWTNLRLPSLTGFGVFYTIPSISLFALLIPYTGLGTVTAEIPLVGYNVLILLRNVLVGALGGLAQDRSIPGVVETGLFIRRADVAIRAIDPNAFHNSVASHSGTASGSSTATTARRLCSMLRTAWATGLSRGWCESSCRSHYQRSSPAFASLPSRRSAS